MVAWFRFTCSPDGDISVHSAVVDGSSTSPHMLAALPLGTGEVAKICPDDDPTRGQKGVDDNAGGGAVGPAVILLC